MARLLLLSLICVLGQDLSFFPSLEPTQCTGLYGPREGPQERWNEVAAWMKTKAPSVHIDDRIVMSPGKYGDQVTSTADAIKRGEILLRLPVQSFLLEEDCFPTKEFAQLATGYTSSLSKLPTYSWNISKTNGADFTQSGLCLLIHRLLGKDSPYEGYLRHLPRQSSGETYMFRGLSEFDCLKGTDAYRVGTVVKRRHIAMVDNIAGPALKMIREYFPSLNLTEAELKVELQQTLSLCGSRTFNLDSGMLSPSSKSTKVSRPALVPLLDMLNHGDGRSRNCQYIFNTSGQFFQLQATRDIEPGAELIHSYGTRSNAELLLFYGFMMEGNTEDFVAVADLAPGALDYNYHTQLGHRLQCHTPYFRPVEGSAWPPKFQTVIKNASTDTNASALHLGPLRASVFHSFQAKLQQSENDEQLTSTFTELALNAGAAVLRIVDGEFVLTHSDKTKLDNLTAERGNLTINLVWRGSPHPPSCEAVVRPRCEDFAAGITSVSTIVAKLQQGLLPAVARTGGCMVWSERKKHMYEIKLAADGTWAGVVAAGTLPQPGSGLVDENAPHEADLLREFQFKRYIIRAAGLEEFTVKLFRTGLLQETLAAIRIAVLPTLSSFAIHSILSGNRFGPDLEQQVAKTLAMFCFEELTRRLQVLGIDTEEESLPKLLYQARALALTGAQGSYAMLARNEVGILTDFCSGIAEWGLSMWE